MEGSVKNGLKDALLPYDENKHNLEKLLEQRNDETSYRIDALDWLNKRVFANRKPQDLNTRILGQIETEEADNLGVHGLQCTAYLWWAQQGVFNYAVEFRLKGYDQYKLPATLALWDGGTDSINLHKEWILQQCILGRAVFILDASGMGAMKPSDFNASPHFGFYGVIYKLCHDLIWLGDSIAALRTFDVVRALDMLDERKNILKSDHKVFGSGNYGLYALLAASVDNRIHELDVADCFISFSEIVKSKRYYSDMDISSVVLPGVLRHFDLPDLSLWLAAAGRMKRNH
jgi:hypothetical protein